MFGLQTLILRLSLLRWSGFKAVEVEFEPRGAVAANFELCRVPVESGGGEGAVDEGDEGVGTGENGATAFFLCDDDPSFGRFLVFKEGTERRSGSYRKRCSWET